MTSDGYVTLSRDPFARLDTIRMTEERGGGCDWCGRRRPSGRLFVYGVETDNGHPYWDSKAFCCRSCRESYHG